MDRRGWWWSAPASSGPRWPPRPTASGVRSPWSRPSPYLSCGRSGPRWVRACAALHRDNGVDLRLGVGVEGFDGRDRVEGVRLTDGTVVAADVVVVGVGVAPATGWLEGSGLELRDGVVCDASLAAGPPGVYAAGDVAPLAERALRRGDAGRALDERRRAGRARRPHPVAAAGGDAADALRARAVLLERPVRPEAAVPRAGRAGRRGPGGPRIHRGTSARRSSRSTAVPAGSAGVLGIARPKLVMGYLKLLAAGITWDDALAHATATS